MRKFRCLNMNSNPDYEIIGNEKYNVEVTVWMTTYNHGKYIENAIREIFLQKVSFGIEIVIFDDASTDDTSEIITRLQSQYNNILYLRARQNTYIKGNRNQLIYEIENKYLTGKYTAVCEGDDIWIDRTKLQRQYDFMERHKECALTIHNAIWIDCTNSSEFTMFPSDPYEDITSHILGEEEVICMAKRNPPTASFFHRRYLLDEPFFYFNAMVGDYTLQLNALNKGTIYYDNRIMSAYRFHVSGGYTERLAKDKSFAMNHALDLSVFLKRYNDYTKGYYEEFVLESMDAFLTSGIMLAENLEEIVIALDEMVDNSKIDLREKEFILCRTKNIWNHIYDNDLKDYINQHAKTYIFGAGDYSKKLCTKANDKVKNVTGIVVTSMTDNLKEICNKKVITIDQIDEQDVGFIIAVSPRVLPQIVRILESKGFNNWVCPFLGSTKMDLSLSTEPKLE